MMEESAATARDSRTLNTEHTLLSRFYYNHHHYLEYSLPSFLYSPAQFCHSLCAPFATPSPVSPRASFVPLLSSPCPGTPLSPLCSPPLHVDNRVSTISLPPATPSHTLLTHSCPRHSPLRRNEGSSSSALPARLRPSLSRSHSLVVSSRSRKDLVEAQAAAPRRECLSPLLRHYLSLLLASLPGHAFARGRPLATTRLSYRKR